MSQHELARSGLPALRLDHLQRMTDTTGMLQHAFYTSPDPLHGYTTDDNARALIVALQYSLATGSEESHDLVWRYLSFLRYAQRPDGLFHNFMAYDRTWMDEVGSDDCQGRAVWALGYALATSPQSGMSRSAELLLECALPGLDRVRSPRGQALCLLGLSWACQVGYQEGRVRDLMARFADNLVRLWEVTAEPDWLWFENILAYDNPKLCEGLLNAYVSLGENRYFEIALESLAFLLGVYFEGDMLDVIGQDGWYPRGGPRAVFDQQPIEAQAMVQACVSAHQVTGDDIYLEHGFNAFSWFLGANRLGRPLYDPTSGGCFDGLHPDRVNGNQGAESTLAYLLSRLAFEVPLVPRACRWQPTTEGVPVPRGSSVFL
ncbi:MAG: hypothetical protein HPY83_15860 [Anaerolineae bacterium]|nr:hypothetical protein [Anaerolineae bacterium]